MALKKESVFSKSAIKEFQNTIQTKNLEINLFEVTFFLFAQFVYLPTPARDSIIENLMKKHNVLGTLRDDYVNFYRQLIESVVMTYKKFTEIDVNVVEVQRDNFVEEYMQMIDSFAALAQTPKHFTTVQRLQIVPTFIFDTLKLHHDIDYLQEDFILALTGEV